MDFEDENVHVFFFEKCPCVFFEDENVHVYKEQIPREKTNYMLPLQYANNADKYVLRYENVQQRITAEDTAEDTCTPSTAEDSVFDIHDADLSLDADPSYFSELNEKNEEIAANDDLEEHDVSNFEELIA